MARPAPAPPQRGPGLPSTRQRRRLDVRLAAIAATLVLVGSIVQTSVPSLSASPARSAHASPMAAVVHAPPGQAPEQQPVLPRVRPDPDGAAAAMAPVAVAAPAPLGPPARVVYRVTTRRKLVALTFDDGWSPAAGRLILATLLREHVTATFFVNARYVRWDPTLWRTIAADGFVIGNHTYDHRDLTTMSTTAIEADLRKDADVFRQLTGYGMAPIFRPPYGAHNRRVDAAVRAAGYSIEVLWDVVAGDSDAARSDAALLASATRGRPGSIVLMHVGPSSTPRILAAVIASYRARGFQFVTVPELIAAGP